MTQENREYRILKTLSDLYHPTFIEVVNNSHLHKGHLGDDGTSETHYKVVIKSNTFVGLSRVESHKAIKKPLQGEFDLGLHALEIKILK